MRFSLDDERTQKPQQSHGRRRLSGPGPDRRAANRLSRTISPYSFASNQQMGCDGGSKSVEPTKLYISNLDYEVTNDDIKILFSEVGQLKLHSIHYDRSGRSKGTAEVVYEQHTDAIEAIKRYNDCVLDGKPLKIELVGVHVVAPPLVLFPYGAYGDSILGRPNIAKNSVYGHGKEAGKRVVGGGVGGYGRSRGFERRMKQQDHKNLTAEDLDAELERYHLEALQIN